jgi:hypothetical protein
LTLIRDAITGYQVQLSTNATFISVLADVLNTVYTRNVGFAVHMESSISLRLQM